MISNNAGDQIARAARDTGLTVVTWDSQIPSAEGEQVFVAQVDFDETGVVMADMALNILGSDGGDFAVLSATPDAANQSFWIAAIQNALEHDKYAARSTSWTSSTATTSRRRATTGRWRSSTSILT